MQRPEGSRIVLWINRDEDSGHGLAEEICPDSIQMRVESEPYHYAVQDGIVLGVNVDGMVIVPVEAEERAIEAAEEQPEENVHLHYARVIGQEIVSIYLLDGTEEPFIRKPSVMPDDVQLPLS